MKKYLLLGIMTLLLAACSGQTDMQEDTSPNVVVYKSPT
jgi:hypothetical protein